MPADAPNATTAVTVALKAIPAIPAAGEWGTILSMAGCLIKSGLLPTAIKTAEAAAAIILKGRELSIPAMQAFSHIHIIQGKPTCSSELQLALLARGGVTWDVDERDGVCEVVFFRPAWPDYTGRYTMAEAKAAGLTTKDSWKNYPANMLRARAISNGARVIGPDLLCGMSYTPEELGADVDEEEAPVVVQAQVETVTPHPLPDNRPPGKSPGKPIGRPKRTVGDTLQALDRDWPGERTVQDIDRIYQNHRLPSRAAADEDVTADLIKELADLYRLYYTDLIEEIKALEPRVAQGPDHLTNLRNKYIGETDAAAWTAKEHIGKLLAYVNHLRDQAAEKE